MNPLAVPWDALDKFLAEADKGGASLANRSGLGFIAFQAALRGRSVLIIAEDGRADSLGDDLRVLASQAGALKNYSVGAVPFQSAREKNALLEEAAKSKGILWSASKEAVLEPCLSRKDFLGARLQLKAGKTLSYTQFVTHLSEQGYQRAPFVEDAGEFSVRGEVLDFWSPNCESPVRLIFHHDTVESLHFFDPAEQRTLAYLPEVTVVSCCAGAKGGSLLDHLPADALIFDCVQADLPASFRKISVLPSGADLGVLPATPIHLRWALFARELAENAAAGIVNVVFCANMGESQRLEDHLDGMRLKKDERPAIMIGPLSEGFRAAAAGISVWSFRDIAGGEAFFRRRVKFQGGRSLASIMEIAAGDFVVHENFGIGRYRGLEKMTFKRGAESEFLYLEYKGGDRLYVPIQDFKLVQKYVGAEGKRPTLNSLDRASWERTKEKVRQEVADLARELLKTAAAREALRRPAGTQEYLMKEFEDAFPYDETPDQEAAIQKVLSDLESPRLMDHLVCGDVGYGKTEIAMRAAFRAVLDTKQVAVLVPTTILAEQHFKNFSDRFAAFPVKIGMISRFQGKAEQVEVLESAAMGAVDILIGTHRLIQKDVSFKNLGLVIIDEEHRFGVKQKEALKKLKVNADFLALSATPIPRTLSLAMGGIRNISVVESPPEGRLPIETRVGLFDENLLKEAVERELARGGQLFYVHNRIQTIHTRKDFLEKLFPKIRIGIAHGQMSAEALEAAMWNFLHRKWDILLSTTIIESGLDIPNVNTLIVEDTEEFGLAQLYQLRGRVGRQRQKAYCLLFFSDWARLSEDARKRLTAIQEFSALGSGMKLALRDMEIRGTGNLLGPQQHGWVAAVGLDLYCQLLSEEAEKVKRGEDFDESDLAQEDIPPEIELEVSALIPESYVEPPGERIGLYKKMLAARSRDDLEKIRAEMLDRFGAIPMQAENLLKVMGLSVEARNRGLGLVLQTSKGFVLGWNVQVGEHPLLDLARFAEAHPNLIEVLPPDASKKEKELLRIFFKEEITDPFGQAGKFLKLADSFATIRPYAKK